MQTIDLTIGLYHGPRVKGLVSGVGFVSQIANMHSFLLQVIYQINCKYAKSHDPWVGVVLLSGVGGLDWLYSENASILYKCSLQNFEIIETHGRGSLFKQIRKIYYIV